MFLVDASIISLKVWPQIVTSLWGLNWLSCISKKNNLVQYEIFFIFVTERFVWFMTESVVTCMTAFSFRVSQKKITFYLSDHGSRHHMTKTEEHWQCKKHYQTGHWSNGWFDAHHTPQRWFVNTPSDVFVLLDTQGQGTIQICLRKISIYVGFRRHLSYRTETSGISLKQQKYMKCYHNRILKNG